MRLLYIIVLCFATLFNSCQNKKTKSIVKGNNDSIVKGKYKFDSVALNYKFEAYKKEKTGDIEGAIKCYTKAIEINPYYDTAYYNRGVLKGKIRDNQGAIEDYCKAIEISPNYSSAYLGIGVINAELGKIKIANDYYNKAIEVNSKNFKAYFFRALLKDNREAIEDYSKAIEANPNYVSAYYNRGYIYSELGDNDKALADYKKALEVSPKPLQADAADMLANMGRIYYDREEFTQALACYNQAIEVAPNDGDLYYGRGLTKKRLDDKNGACADWRKAQALGIYAANALLTICDE